MRILHILGAWPPEYGGGVTETTVEIARDQRDAGHDVHVLVGASQGIPSQDFGLLVEQGITVWRFGLPDYFKVEPEGWWLPHHDALAHERWVASLVKHVVLTSRIQIVDYHVNRALGEEAIFEIDRLGIPLVASLHDFWLICGRVTMLHAPTQEPCSGPALLKCSVCLRAAYEDGRSIANLKAVYRLAFRSPNPLRKLRRRRDAARLFGAAMARSRFLADMHRPFINGPCEASLVGVRHSGQISRVPRQPGALRFGFFAGDQPGKGLVDVMAAAHTLRREGLSFEIHVFGNLAKPIDDSCVTRGQFSRIDRNAAYESIDIAIMATTHVEPRGRIAEEAALSGRPAIVANVGGLPETIRSEQSGLLFAFRDRRDLTRQMRRVLVEPGLLQKLTNDVKLPENLREAVPKIEQTYADVLARFSERNITD